MTDTAAKKDIQKLQRAIVDALEDVKAQDLQVFDTEHLSPLFERVIIASGTSNRQTKALAASVRDKVREAGFGKPRIEGEDNGEWIIVDCGAAVAHIMQPTIRTYYNLEEIWGDKPVRLKFGAPKPVAPEPKTAGRKTAAKKAAAKAPAAKTSTAKPAAKAKVALKAPAKSAKPSAKAPAKTAAKPGAKSAAGKTTAKTAVKSTSKPTVKTVGKPSPKAASKAAATKAPARKAVKAPTRRKAD
ncbi:MULTISPECIES: ribosome silencing factor [unclassified Limnohabitans]|jgi:ribosome-associated protein|uniref:ribosome silencing factor n=1 Tax=unclassified Limnohabitans TaxID=2626134 RepID=UPI000D38BC07|nr:MULTISPECIES: ribosome silencing factor [unclassified Limnohabitans]PUE22084.1 ribosome silencing factor [Limnohabitans sp. MMS-10A-192]PUE25735.1 ribosome silencing factor [Limnohabitans sp. MMS-10A-160]